MVDSPLETALRVASEHREQGRIQAARDVLRKALTSDSDAAALYVALGRVELVDERWEEATHAFASASQLRPWDLDAAIGMVIGLIGGRQVTYPQARKIDGVPRWMRTAASLLDRLGDVDLDDPDAAAWRLDAVRRLNLGPAARELASKTVERHPDIAAIRRQVALMASERDDWEEAASEFEHVFQLDPDDVASVRQHAHALAQLHRDADARAVVERALALHPERPDLNVALALLEEHASHLHEAEAAFAAALAFDEHDVAATLGRARVLRELGRLDAARAAATAACSLDPAAAHAELGQIALEAHEYLTARRCFERARSLGDDTPEARTGLRRARRRTGGRPLAGIRRSLDRRTWGTFSDWQSDRTVLQSLLGDDARRCAEAVAASDRLSWRYARLDAVEDLVLELLAWTWFAAFVVALADVRRVLDPPHPLPAGIASFGVTVALIVGSIAFIALAVALFAVTDHFRVLAGTVFVYAAGAAVLAAEGGHLPVTLAYALECSLSLAVTGIGAVFVLIVPPALASTFVRWRLVKGHSAAAAVIPLARLLRRAQIRSPQLGSNDDVERLEDAATAIRTCLRNRKPTGDRRTDAWLVTRADGVATAMRELKMWLLTPGGETAAALEQRLMLDLRSIADGRLRDLHWTDPDAALARRRRVLGITIARNLIIAAVPTVALLAFESFGWLHLSSGTADQALVAALGWALITLLITLDPHFQDKVGILQGSLKSFRPDR